MLTFACRSFALALALLSKDRGTPYKAGDGSHMLPITSLLLVPHRDLAYQFYHWIERIHHHMTKREPLPSLAQVLVRDSAATLEEHLAPIHKTPPHILIGTPQMVLDIVQADPTALPLDRLSTVVVDEVDYLIETVPNLPDKFLMMKIERQINRHPGPTRLLLNHIYSASNARRKPYQMSQMQGLKGEDHRRDDSQHKPQLIMMSATLRNHLKRFLLADSGWFTRDPGMFVRITGDASVHYPKDLKNSSAEDHATFALGGHGIQHHVLVVSDKGSIANIEGAAKGPQRKPEEESKPSPGPSSAPAEQPSHSVSPDVEEIGKSHVAFGLHATCKLTRARRRAFALQRACNGSHRGVLRAGRALGCAACIAGGRARAAGCLRSAPAGGQRAPSGRRQGREGQDAFDAPGL